MQKQNPSVFIGCECHSDEHTLRYTIDAEDRTIYTSVFLNHYLPWYKRAWVSVKYLFGYKCKYGHFDCTLMGVTQVAQLKQMIIQFEELTKQSPEPTWVKILYDHLHELYEGAYEVEDK